MIHVAGMFGAGGHDSDYREWLRIQRDFASNDVGIGAKARTPQSVADDNLQPVAGNLRLEVEFAPDLRMKTEHTEIAGSDSEAVEVNGLDPRRRAARRRA